MTQTELEKYLWGAATALRGTIDAGDYKQYIFPLLFFKRISDVYDEEFQSALAESDNDEAYAAFAENHHFMVPQGSHWNDVREVTTNIGMALQEAMRAIEQANPDTLYGIFGDASWTNKERLSDEMLTNLIEHFSQHSLSIANVPDDKLGDAYEYLIKEFADDSGHTAAEFYTNRTVVKLMTMIMDPQPGESVYDPTCGSGGLLLNCALHLKEEGKEYRTLKLYGQEINLLTSAIARMNMFMHGIEEFDIVRGNTLANPGLLENDTLKTFNVILANPPYSIKSWDRKSFINDPYGRNIWGTPPQGCADYAFQQHMQKSLDKDNGRCISLWPHGILFRDAEADMRRQMIEDDLVECVIGLGPNLFYNSPMEACLLITRTNKEEHKKGKILFINAVKEVKQEKNMGYLEQHHIDKTFSAYQAFESQQDFAELVSVEEVLEKKGNMAINLYIRPDSLTDDNEISLPNAYKKWQDSSLKLKQSMGSLLDELTQSTSYKSGKKGGGVLLNSLLTDEKDQNTLNIENFIIDKSDWKPVKLGDVVFEPKESTKDPIADGIKHVVGLEHIDYEDIHLRRFATLEEASTTFTKKFAKGDVLFGRRRAYLKKAAKADFDGICSGDITVMRAKEGLLPELLPFLINNDKFFDFAIKHSAGGLSPRVKFKDLANFEFYLPPNKTQRNIIKIFSNYDFLTESEKTVKKQLTKTFETEIELRIHGETLLGKTINQVIESLSKKMPVTSINNMGDVFKGRGIPKSEVLAEGIPSIRYGELYTKHHRIIRKYYSYISTESAIKATQLQKHDILFAGSGETITEIGKSAAFVGDTETYAGGDILIFRPDDMDGTYLGYLMNSQLVRQQLNKFGTGATVMHVYASDIEKIQIPRIDRKKQIEIGEALESISKNISLYDKKIKQSKTLQKELTNQVF